MDMGLNSDLYPTLPGSRHISDADAEMLFATAGADSPELREWQARGGFANSHWASGLEHLISLQMYQTFSVGVAVLDMLGWRGSGILHLCGHTSEFKAGEEVIHKYVQQLPLNCFKCKKIMESMG